MNKVQPRRNARSEASSPLPATTVTELPPFLKQAADAVMLFVKVQPRASRDEIGEVLGAELKVKIAAPPVESAANDALVRFLAAQLKCARGSVRLVRGQSSRHKVVAIADLDARLVLARLAVT